MTTPSNQPPLKICMVSSEVVPFAKTGGLADVVGALATEFARLGHDVCVLLPAYRQVDALGQPERGLVEVAVLRRARQVRADQRQALALLQHDWKEEPS